VTGSAIRADGALNVYPLAAVAPRDKHSVGVFALQTQEGGKEGAQETLSFGFERRGACVLLGVELGFGFEDCDGCEVGEGLDLAGCDRVEVLVQVFKEKYRAVEFVSSDANTFVGFGL
jgi:hypothetical protein